MGVFQKGDLFPRGLRMTGEAREHEAHLTWDSVTNYTLVGAEDFPFRSGPRLSV